LIGNVEGAMATVLITGANRGIGLQLAALYAARGDSVIAAVRDPSKSAEVRALGSRIDVMPLDVTSEASFAAAVKALLGRKIDILIANAGVMGPRGPAADEQPADVWSSVLAVNVTGSFLTVRAFLPNVIAAKGKIAILSSIMASSEKAMGNSYVYRASKAAVANIGLNLAVELKPNGVSVGNYHPGWVQTDMGGAAADIPATVSATGLVARIDRLSLATTGVFETFSGAKLAY
jgi:NAD(P)-dependent dehydrogenase (short-subunit alcohol dehydrogenase family)